MKNIGFQAIFDTPDVKQGDLRGEYQTPDGNVYTYLVTTEAIDQYMVVSSPANLDVDTVSSAANSLGEIIFITEASAGWTAGAYQDHWMIVDDGTGAGQTAKIKDNTADTLELYPEWALATALAVGDSDIVIRHAYDAEKVPVTVEETPCLGVAQTAFASGDYGYFLKRGVGGVLAGEAITINIGFTPGDNTEGTVIKATTTEGSFDSNTLGRCLVANASNDKAFLADVNIA